MDNNGAVDNLVINNDNQEETQEIIQNNFGVGFGNLKVEEMRVEKDIEDDDQIGKKEMNTILTNLNSYWIELIGSFGLFLYIYVIEIIALILLASLLNLLNDPNISFLGHSLSFIFQDIGVKYFILIAVFQHLSVGFFCLTTFSSIFQETLHIKRFIICNSIKVVCYYILSISILYGLIKTGIKNFSEEHIESVLNENPDIDEESKKKILDLVDSFTKKVIIFVGNFLAVYNVFYDKFILGFLYIFLFTTPYDISGYKKVLFRMCSIFPIAIIVASLALRALMTREELYINVFISPLFLGSKIVIYGFFVITLFAIKIKSIKYNVYEGEFISPKVFKKMASKIFSLLGFVELIIALAFPRWTNIGIGQKYLLILCAPIITLYDYKKKKKVKFPCCNKGDISLCFKIIVNIVGYLVAIVFAVALYFEISLFIDQYIKDILNIIINNLDLLLGIISNII